MTFTKKKIPSKIIGIVDIGTYKIRVGICKLKNKELELIGYGEKRQDTDDIILQEYVNIEGICANINKAIEKAEQDSHTQVEDIIINIPFDELFFEHSKINYIRENSEIEIDKKELYKIIQTIESQSIQKHLKNIKQISGYTKENLKLIISGINEIKIDSKKTKALIGKAPREINISLLNIFIPENKYELTQSLARRTGKTIVKIIPSELAITNLFKTKKDIVIIDLGNSHTSIIVKKDYDILGVKKISVGINALIKQIKANHDLRNIEIINSIEEAIYLDEKEEFMKIFKDILIISLEEILGNSLCPSDFFMTGGGSGKFVRNYLKNIDLNQNNLKIAKNISFVSPKIEYLENIDSSKSNLNIYAMMMSTLDFIKKEKDPIEESIIAAVKEIEAR
ncbi:hypothetical protein A9Q91_00910 [Candidatus Gracilibacteria bacterium 28_42_T64]|nr:hypothetical protein A9Q91_00910 [Candidatus Gracilibacteria bacterium 28_42_T64]